MAPQCILGADASLLNNVFSALILSHCVLNLLGNEMGLAKVTNGLHVAKSHPKAWSSFHLLYCHLTEWNPPLHHETLSSPGCQNSRLSCLAFYLSGCPLSVLKCRNGSRFSPLTSSPLSLCSLPRSSCHSCNLKYTDSFLNGVPNPKLLPELPAKYICNNLLNISRWINNKQYNQNTIKMDSLISTSNLFPFNFWPHRVACGILAPQPGIKPVPRTVDVHSLNHWTAREVPNLLFQCFPPQYKTIPSSKLQRL